MDDEGSYTEEFDPMWASVKRQRKGDALLSNENREPIGGIIVSGPAWLMTTPNEWLKHLDEAKTHPSHRRMATIFAGTFTEAGYQYKPITASWLGKAAGMSQSAVERFLRKMRERGLIYYAGRYSVFQRHKRATPYYLMAAPQGQTLGDDALRGELAALCSITSDGSQPSWEAPLDDAPDWLLDAAAEGRLPGAAWSSLGKK